MAKLIGFRKAKPCICCCLMSLACSDAVFDLVELTPWQLGPESGDSNGITVCMVDSEQN